MSLRHTPQSVSFSVVLRCVRAVLIQYWKLAKSTGARVRMEMVLAAIDKGLSVVSHLHMKGLEVDITSSKRFFDVVVL